MRRRRAGAIRRIRQFIKNNMINIAQHQSTVTGMRIKARGDKLLRVSGAVVKCRLTVELSPAVVNMTYTVIYYITVCNIIYM